MFRLKPLSIFLLLCLCGCHAYVACPWNIGYTKITGPLKMADLKGKYVLTSNSKKMMQYEGKYTHLPNSIIELNMDSTYTITNAPDWIWNDLGKSSNKYINQKGKWSFSCTGKDNCKFDMMITKNGVMIYQDFEPYTKNSKMYILVNIGDPDDCLGMVFEKH